jgi:hypothetical protein
MANDQQLYPPPGPPSEPGFEQSQQNEDLDPENYREDPEEIRAWQQHRERQRRPWAHPRRSEAGNKPKMRHSSLDHNLDLYPGKGNPASRVSSISGGSGTYDLIADAYREAAAEHSILPNQMQSITWEAIRHPGNPQFFPDTSKRKTGQMGPIRKAVSLVFALALTGGGLYVLRLLFTAEKFFGHSAMVGSLMLALGLYWLWTDFVGPLFGIKGEG